MPERPTGGPRANPKSKGPREPQGRAPKTEPTSSPGAPRQKPTSKKPQEQEPPPMTANPRTRERIQKAQSRPRGHLPGRSLSQMCPPTPMRTSGDIIGTRETAVSDPFAESTLANAPSGTSRATPTESPEQTASRSEETAFAGKTGSASPSWTAGGSLEKPTPTPSQQEASQTDQSSPKPTPTSSRKTTRRRSKTKPPRRPRSKVPSWKQPPQKPLYPQRPPRPLPKETHP